MIFSLENHHPELDSTVYIAPGAQLIGNIKIGKESSVWFNAVIRGDNAPIVIGERSNIQDGSILHVDANVPLNVGNEVTVGHNVILHGCTIKDGALIGMGSTIMNHAVIGEQVLIAANTLITQGKVIPPRTLVMGNPGKVVRELTEQEWKSLRSSAEHYAAQSRRYLAANIQIQK
ncbi:gamma carbonic anhydrase family protein [Paenibacillus naphthalenovorans]|uniref:gamma carbonic anhydrase family protein n=1 Tax=Paenibacillus naphthalenovorans TaxID=162209 RepID=UPI003D2C41FD